MQVEQLQEQFDIEVEWRPFELHPEIPPEGKDLGIRGSAYYDRLRELAEEAGLAFQAPTRVPNSHRSLEAAEFAREHGTFERYHRVLFEAYFGQGRDIGDAAVLTELGAASGLDAAALCEALESRRYASLVDERTEEARQWGVSGTPTFVFESSDRRFPLVGAQEYTVFENVARRMGAMPRTENREPRTKNPDTARS